MIIPAISIDYSKEKEHKGIIDYIKKQTNSSNIHRDGIVTAQYSSLQKDDKGCRPLAPLGINSSLEYHCWFSENQLGEWYSIDFIKNCLYSDIVNFII